ncbi:SDR family oxidoreductase [bacterium]|nr:SDR family oxidoreductase [bacterium]
MTQLHGRIAVVTGAAMGMGRMLSSLLLEEGCRVALVDVNEEMLQTTQKELSRKGDCMAYPCDISDSAAVYKLAKSIESEFGDATLLINNAGIVKAGRLLELEDKVIEKTISVNLTAQFWTVKAFLPKMIELNDGHIINFASAGGILSIPCLSAYCASKFGVIGFTDAIRQEMKKEKRNIRFTVVCPNTVNTGMFKGAKMVTGTRMLKPETVCHQVLKGIKGNKAVIAVPSVPVKIVTPLLKTLLPVNVMDRMNKMLGMWDANDTWTGR